MASDLLACVVAWFAHTHLACTVRCCVVSNGVGSRFLVFGRGACRYGCSARPHCWLVCGAHAAMEHEFARAIALWCWAGGSVAKEHFADSVFKICFISPEGLHLEMERSVERRYEREWTL